jgi:putative ABC transport system permease protein
MRLHDVRYALRNLWHSKGFAVVAILCLGFGIGLNTTIFSIVDGVLLQPYPYPDPDRLLVLDGKHSRTGETQGLSFLDLRDLKEANPVLTTIAGSMTRALTVSDGTGEPERHLGAAISWDLFPLLGTEPILGRGFTADDDRPNAGGVVLLSHALWTRRYQADRGILGRSILVDAQPHVVIGVMPPGFEFPFNQRLWIPLAPATVKDTRDERGLFAMGRMKPGVTQTRTVDALNAAAATLETQYPTTNEGWRVEARTLRKAFLPDDVPVVLALMMAGVTLVLFIACSNVANLLIARAAWRRREFAVRAAIGAGRGRIIRQLLTESVVLGLTSVPLGVALAVVGTRLISSAIPVDQIPYYVQWRVDGRSLAYAIAVAAATSIIFGLFPALQASRGELHETLKEGTRGNSGSHSWLRSGLVVVQVALALVALVGALLFVRTFMNLDSYELGFNVKPLMTLRFYMTGAGYEPDDAKLRRVEDIVRRVEGLPGVQAAFASNLIPISGGGGGGRVEIEGRAIDARERANITFTGVTPGFHRALGVQIVRGRDFTEAEGWSRTPVAIINKAMAARYWPNADPIERRFRLTGGANNGEWFRVVGVAPDLHLFGVDPSNREAVASAFVPYAYQQTLSTGLTVRVEGGAPASIASALRTEIRGADPNIPTYWVRTMEDVRRVSFWQYGLYGWIFGTIGVVGLLLAAVGVYGVLSYSVSQRTQEIGIRVALGASRSHVVKLVIGQALLLAGAGIVVGMAMAAFGMPLAKSLLYNVSPFDPLSFSLVSAFLLIVALIASYLPARHAVKVDPVVALRGE